MATARFRNCARPESRLSTDALPSDALSSADAAALRVSDADALALDASRRPAPRTGLTIAAAIGEVWNGMRRYGHRELGLLMVTAGFIVGVVLTSSWCTAAPEFSALVAVVRRPALTGRCRGCFGIEKVGIGRRSGRAAPCEDDGSAWSRWWNHRNARERRWNRRNAGERRWNRRNACERRWNRRNACERPPISPLSCVLVK